MTLKRMGLVVSLLLLAGNAHAQVDVGAPDSLIMDVIVIPDATTNKLKFQVDLFVFNDENKLTALSCGFGWDNPKLQMDSAKGSILASQAFDQRFLFDGSSIGLTNAGQRFLFSGFTFGSRGLNPSATRQYLASYYFSLSEWGTSDEINLDTNQYDPGAELLFIDQPTGTPYIPHWTGHILVRDTAYTVPSNMILSTEFLEFIAQEGAAPPSPQSFQISSDNDPFDVLLSEDAPWLLKSPSLATTPATINISINNFGLTAGEYLDTILIESDKAANSPKEVVVSLIVAPPPAQIEVNQTNYLFNAVVDGANPDPQILEISNLGGQDLNWTASNNSSWLSPAPASGVNAASVSLNVDITSLAIGEYRDTVVIADPASSNKSVRVAIRLSVASGLPLISVVDSTIMVVVDLPPDRPDTISTGPPALEVPPVTIEVLNRGGGVMNFTATESTTLLDRITPDSGTAPQELLVEFRISSGLEPGDYYDTLWIHSDEATNSPYPVEFHFYARSHPAEIFCNRDTLHLQIHECLDGALQELPTWGMWVGNTGGEHPMMVSMVYESDLFVTDKLLAAAPTNFTITPLDAGLSVGVYYDSLWVVAEKAVNNPQLVVIEYEVLPTTEAPEIHVLLNAVGIEAVAQEDSGPFGHSGFNIYNLNFGCMEWHFEGSVQWAIPNMSSGTAYSDVDFVINPTGYEVGSYTDTILIVAPGAVNSPQRVPMSLHIWRLRGDMDLDGRINLVDITFLISYVYLGGAAPWPALTIGDVDCDGLINLADITYLISYVYQSGPIPCGNPYMPEIDPWNQGESK